MKFAALLLLITPLFFSCNNNNYQAEGFGVIDTVGIAQDTAMQLGMESSYEYFKTHQWGPYDVYDVVAWGKPDSGELCIIYRGRTNVKDTVVKEVRLGKISASWLSDLDNDQKPEVMLTRGSSNSMHALNAYEFTDGNKPTALKYEPQILTTGGDSIYPDTKGGHLMRLVGEKLYRYTLRENHFSLLK